MMHFEDAVSLVERLRTCEPYRDECPCDEAAARIEATERLVEEAERALKAFVAAIDRAIADDDVSIVDEITDEIENDARTALASIADWRKL